MQDEREDLVWEELSSEHIIQDEWIDFRKHAFRFPDGSEFEPFYSYSRKDYVIVVAVDTKGDLICVRQYRQGIRKVTTEFPAGGIEPGEDPARSAERELVEETGYSSDKWTHLLTVPSNATIADNYAYIYLAEDCRKVSGQQLDETEFLNIEIHSRDELEELIKEGDFEQATHILAWQLALRRL